MKRRLLMAVWLIVGAHALAYVWGGNLDLVPRPPEAFGIWLGNIYGAKNGEDLGDVDMLYMLTVSFIVVAASTGLTRYIWKRLPPRI